MPQSCQSLRFAPSGAAAPAPPLHCPIQAPDRRFSPYSGYHFHSIPSGRQSWCQRKSYQCHMYHSRNLLPELPADRLRRSSDQHRLLSRTPDHPHIPYVPYTDLSLIQTDRLFSHTPSNIHTNIRPLRPGSAIYFSIPPVPSHRSYLFRHIYNCASAEYHNRSGYAGSMPFRIYALNSVCHPVSPLHDGISDHPGSGYWYHIHGSDLLLRL